MHNQMWNWNSFSDSWYLMNLGDMVSSQLYLWLVITIALIIKLLLLLHTNSTSIVLSALHIWSHLIFGTNLQWGRTF